MKEPDEVARPCSTDENCVSGLIGSVLTLIISILVWLQKIGCKNTGNANDCQNACDFNQALEQLTLIAQQTESYGKADITASTSGSASKRLKDDSKKNLKRNRSADNHAVLYAVGEDEVWSTDCKKCCKKVVEPKEKKDKDNVIFEVVAAQMVENEMQTDIKTFVDNFTQPDESFLQEKDTHTEEPCPCPMSTQVSKQSVDRPPAKPESDDKEAQVEIITSSKDITCECDTLEKETSVRFDEDQMIRTAAYAEDEDEEDYDEDEDEDDYNDGEQEYMVCPDDCIPFAQRSQSPVYRQSQYLKGQGQVRQDRSPYYQGYETSPMYKQYNTRYTPRAPYSPMPYQYPRQPYYQKVTRTVQRGPTRPADYQNVPQRQKSPTQRTSLYEEGDADFKGVDKVSQSEPVPPPQPIPIKALPPPRTSKTETPPQQREQPMFKECVPNCPGTKIGVRKVSAVAPVPAPMQRTAAIEKPEPPPNQKKCLARCAKSPHSSNTSNQPKTSASKEKSRSVALMPKGAIPIEVNAVLETEKATGQPDIVASVVMSVEPSKPAQ